MAFFLRVIALTHSASIIFKLIQLVHQWVVVHHSSCSGSTNKCGGCQFFNVTFFSSFFICLLFCGLFSYFFSSLFGRLFSGFLCGLLRRFFSFFYCFLLGCFFSF